MIKDVNKSFKLGKAEAKKQARQQVQALQQLSFSCNAGEVTALLGANGAGKTTCLRLLSTAISPDSGEIWFKGTEKDIPIHNYPRRARAHIGFLSDATPLYRRLSVRENLQFFGKLYQMTTEQVDTRINQLAEQLKFSAFIDQKVDALSTGMTQKASIARAILHNPELIVLDEPTTGLDVQAAEQILHFITEMRAQGKTIVFSTHHMAEVELLADQICIIQQGKAVFSGTLEQAKLQTGCENMTQAFLALVEQGAA